MGDLIPHLQEIRENPNGYDIPEGFVSTFLKVHGEDWRTAQSHWEVVVEKVLDTDAVDPRATGAKAMRQAVRASYRLLDSMTARSRCPICRGVA